MVHCTAQAQLPPDQAIEGSLTYNQYYYFKITVKKQKKGVKIQVSSISSVLNLHADVQLYFFLFSFFLVDVRTLK